MNDLTVKHYDQLQLILSQTVGNVTTIKINDHLGGFDTNYYNPLLEQINKFAEQQQCKINTYTSYIPETRLTNHYPWLNFKLIIFPGWQQFQEYTIHPNLTFKKFICSFNGSAHVSRKLLTALLHKFKWFDPECCSKNFNCSTDVVDGHINDYVGNQTNFYRKFFIDSNSSEFLNSNYSFGHNRYNHKENIYTLQNQITSSFLHVVSETMVTNHYPIITEKFLYSVVTRGLFLAYAPVGWHLHLEKYFGFKRFTKIFDYRFDSIINPVERLVELASMISKFGVLSSDDWKDIYLIEQDTIEYNYNHYFSQDYLKCLAKYS